MKKILSIIALQFFSLNLLAQTNFDRQWVSGGSLNYKTTFTGGQAINSFVGNNGIYFLEGHSNICDSNGNLILCSDGFNVYDSNFNYLDDGDTLVPKLLYQDQFGFNAYSGGSYFLPFDNSKYVLVTPTMSDSHFIKYVQSPDIDSQSKASFDLLLYHVIDMKANNGAGKVVKKAIELLTNLNTDRVRMTACKHANGKDWWVLKQGTDTNMIYSFLFKQDTVEGPFMQGFAEPHFGRERGWANNNGQSTFNQQGTKYASGANSWKSNFFMADFDRCTGLLSNPKTVNVPLDSAGTSWEDNSLTGLVFSNNNQFIYVIKAANIWQFDLSNPDSATAWYHVAFLDTTWADFQLYVSSYLAPDGKIYIGNRNGVSKQMSTIDNPDIKGAGCNFCPRCHRFQYASATNPPNMPNYDLGPLQPCWPLEVPGVSKEFPKLSCYPNPASTSLSIEIVSNNKGIAPLEMFNMVGELLLKTDIQAQTKVQINISSLPKGVYVIRCEGASQKVVIE